jgi:methyl-accepting chemotaxis protein
LESRVEELTGRVHRSERDAAAARVLAGGADRDVEQIRGEIRDFKQATTASFNAMREDINDLRTEIRAGFADVDRGFADMRGRLDATAAGIEQIANMLGRGEHRPDGPA